MSQRGDLPVSSKPFTLTTPPAFQCYDCQGCGECCRGRFAIVISHDDKNRIVEQGWRDEELGLHGQPLFTQQGHGLLLAHQADGSCIFLNAEGRCRIHARFGESAKPVPCRLYPFRLVPLGSQARVDVRFDCPATASNFGRAIPGYRHALLGLLPNVLPERAADSPSPPLYGRVPATWAQLCRISETFERVLLQDTSDLTRRILSCVNLAARLRSPRIVTLAGRKLSDSLETLAIRAIETMETDAIRRVPPTGMVRLTFRQLLGVYGRIDQVSEPARLGRRLSHALRMVSGRGQVPELRTGFPSVTFEEIDALSGEMSARTTEALERYLHLRLSSMGFFGHDFYQRSYLDGMLALLCTYPLVCWFARAYALGRHLDTPDAACVEQAIQVVDHQHGISPLLNLPSGRYRMRSLCARDNLCSLVIWYGS